MDVGAGFEAPVEPGHAIEITAQRKSILARAFLNSLAYRLQHHGRSCLMNAAAEKVAATLSLAQ